MQVTIPTGLFSLGGFTLPQTPVAPAPAAPSPVDLRVAEIEAEVERKRQEEAGRAVPEPADISAYYDALRAGEDPSEFADILQSSLSEQGYVTTGTEMAEAGAYGPVEDLFIVPGGLGGEVGEFEFDKTLEDFKGYDFDYGSISNENLKKFQEELLPVMAPEVAQAQLEGQSYQNALIQAYERSPQVQEIYAKYNISPQRISRKYGSEYVYDPFTFGEIQTVDRSPGVSEAVKGVATSLFGGAVLGPAVGALTSGAPAALQPALTGALTSAATGGDPLTGALTGGLGGLAEPIITGADLGTLGTAGAEGLSAAAIAEITGGDPLQAGLLTAGTSLGKGVVEDIKEDRLEKFREDVGAIEVPELPDFDVGAGSGDLPFDIDLESAAKDAAFRQEVANITVPEIPELDVGVGSGDLPFEVSPLAPAFPSMDEQLDLEALPTGTTVPVEPTYMGQEGFNRATQDLQRRVDSLKEQIKTAQAETRGGTLRLEKIEDLQRQLANTEATLNRALGIDTDVTTVDLTEPTPIADDILQVPPRETVRPELSVEPPAPDVDLTPPEITPYDISEVIAPEFEQPPLDIAPPVIPTEPIRIPAPFEGGGGGAAGGPVTSGLLTGGSVTNALLTGNFSDLAAPVPAPAPAPAPEPTPSPVAPVPAPEPTPEPTPTPEPIGVEPPVEAVEPTPEPPVEAVEPTDIFTDTVSAMDTTLFDETDITAAREEGFAAGQEGLTEAIETSNQLSETLESTKADLAEQRDVTEALQSDIDGLNESITNLEGTVESLQGELKTAQEAREAAVNQGNQQLADSIAKYEGLLAENIANSEKILADAIEAGDTKVDEAVAAGKTAVDEAVAAGKALGEAKYEEGLGTGRGQGAGAGIGAGLGLGLLAGMGSGMGGVGTGFTPKEFEDYEFRKTYVAPELVERTLPLQGYQAPQYLQEDYAQTVADQIRNLTSFPVLTQGQVQQRLGLFNDALLQEAVMQNLYGAGGR